MAAAAPNATRVAGWLLKRGGMRKSWKRRWFVLTGPCLASPTPTLTYYKTKDETKSPAGVVDLGPYASVALLPLEEHGKDHEFTVAGPELRAYYMAAPSAKLMSEWVVALVEIAGLDPDQAVKKKVDAAAKKHVNMEPNGLGPASYDVYLAKSPMDNTPPVTKDSMFRYRVWLKKDAVPKPVKAMLLFNADGFAIVDGDVETLHKIKAVVKYLFKPEKRMLRFVTKHKSDSITTTVFFAAGGLVSHLETTIAQMIQVLLEDTGILSTVVFDYQSELEDELSVKRGDRIAVLEVFPDGWLLGSLADGTTGMLPVSHVYSDKAVLDSARKKADEKLKRMSMM